MPRRGFIAKRDVLPDPMYNSKIVTRLINNIMLDGKKGVAQKIVYGAFDIISEKTGKNPLEVFDEAMEMIGGEPANQGHHGLEKTEKEADGDKSFPADAAQDDAAGNGNRETVHGQADCQ